MYNLRYLRYVLIENYLLSIVGITVRWPSYLSLFLGYFANSWVSLESHVTVHGATPKTTHVGREFVHLITRVHFRSCDKDGGYTV